MFATILLILVVILCWGHGRTLFTALIAVVLGITLATAGGPLAATSKTAADGLRNGLTTLGTLFEQARTGA
jgi:hypothetical protein